MITLTFTAETPEQLKEQVKDYLDGSAHTTYTISGLPGGSLTFIQAIKELRYALDCSLAEGKLIADSVRDGGCYTKRMSYKQAEHLANQGFQLNPQGR